MDRREIPNYLMVSVSNAPSGVRKTNQRDPKNSHPKNMERKERMGPLIVQVKNGVNEQQMKNYCWTVLISILLSVQTPPDPLPM